jgi:hypothetical protein
MKEKQLSLVTYEQAKRLEKLGFDYPIPSFYFKDGVLYEKDRSRLNGCKGWKGWHCRRATQGIRFSAPTVALALKWIRDEKGIKCTVEQYYAGDGHWRYEGCIYGNHKTSVFDAYESAESALLDKLLTVLEKEKEQ